MQIIDLAWIMQHLNLSCISSSYSWCMHGDTCRGTFKSSAYTRGHNKKSWQLPTRIARYIRSYQNFFPNAIKLWNKLPNHLIDITDLNTFREGLIN